MLAMFESDSHTLSAMTEEKKTALQENLKG